MKFLDRVALNRSMSIVFNFIISLIKLFMPKIEDNNPVPPLPRPPLRRRPRPPILKKEDKNE